MFVALLLGVMIVAWLTTWYRQHPDRQVVVDPLQPLWNKIAVLADRIWWKTPVEDTLEVNSQRTGSPLQWSWTLVVAPQVHPEFITGQIAVADLMPLLETSQTFGSERASIVLLQWCDFWSSYCIESYEKGVLFEYMNWFPEELSYQLKWYPRDTQPTTVLQHQAALCAESLTSKEKFLSFYFNIYQARGELTKEDFIGLAEKLQIDDFAECLDTKNIFALQQEMKRGRALFSFTSLPANILVNKQTGQYVLIPGLYETQDVLQAIQWMLEQN